MVFLLKRTQMLIKLPNNIYHRYVDNLEHKCSQMFAKLIFGNPIMCIIKAKKK